MTLFAMLRRNLGFSLAASLLQLVTTLVVVRLAGPVLFADFTVDLYKLAIIVIALEVVPSPYLTFQSQREPGLAADMASFALLSSIFCVAAWAGIAALDLFTQLSFWMGVYAAYLGIQRYLDIKLQSENRVHEFYQLMAASGATRLVLTCVGLGVTTLPEIDVLWGALALGALLPSAVWMLRKPKEASPFLRRGHRASIIALYEARANYYGYYANTVLKRLRDSFMPVAASFVVSDRVELARYLLAMRGVEAVMGQLRTVEALLSHLGNRALVAAQRNRQMILLAVLAQAGTFAASFLLTFQTGVNWKTIFLCFVASLFAYPYVFELGYRSDAYAAKMPGKVTVSLAAFAAMLAIILFLLDSAELLFAPALVMAHVLAQTVAALSYHVGARLKRAERADS